MSALLQVRSISKSFRGLRAVNNASFEIPEGDINGLIGPNGAGKTTIFNMIAGVYAPDSGSIVFNGVEIQGLRPDQICAAGIGRTLAAYHLDRLAAEGLLTVTHQRRSGRTGPGAGRPARSPRASWCAQRS